MIPVSIPLSSRIFAALRAASVATQAGIASGTWASTTTPRVFRGFGALVSGRNRGRLPFIEFDISDQAYTEDHYEGGTLSAVVTLTAHCGGRDPETASDTLDAILVSGIASIRSESTDNYTALGSDDIQDIEPGPWGFKRKASVSVSFSFSSFDEPAAGTAVALKFNLASNSQYVPVLAL